jgi:cytidyltransferase-like protein
MKRVYVDMVGDLFHQGHVELLKAARALGDYLIVGVLSDRAVTDYKRLPIMSMDERISVIQACRYVDAVIPDAPLIVTSTFLKAHEITLVVHGDDISDEVVKEVYGDAQREGKFRKVKYTKGISTTELINRICARLCVSEPGSKPASTTESPGEDSH